MTVRALRFITYHSETGALEAAVAHADRALGLERLLDGSALAGKVRTVRELLTHGPDAIDLVRTLVGDGATRSAADAGAVDALRLGPPIPDPGKIVCVGLNYRDHAAETGLGIPSVPVLFAKFASTLIGPTDAIVKPPETEQLDYEAELAVVIGAPTSRVSAARAMAAVVGAMCLNDVSARDCQFETNQMVAGKNFDTFAPCGPALVTLEDVGDLTSLDIVAKLAGRVVQEGNTADMIFSVAELVSFVSHRMSLAPGDIISTGTPAGVGMGRRPPRFLHAGDRVEVEIGGLGRLSNEVADHADGDVHAARSPTVPTATKDVP